MDNFCRQSSSISNLIPPDWHWVMHILMPIVFLIIIGVPVAKVLQQAGYNKWWTILAFVPLVNLIALWMFAFSLWPKAKADA